MVELTGAQAPDLVLVRETRRRVPLLMDDGAALQILACVRAAAPLGGAMAEAGVFKGGSARLICEAKGDAALHLFDVFETLQGPAEAEGEAALVRGHFGATHGRVAEVRQLLSAYRNVHFHPGLFPGTAAAVAGLRFAFVHLDLDLAVATRNALDFFHPRLLPGGIIVGDDFGDPGVRSAFENYFAGRPDIRLEQPSHQIVVIKTGG